ncbi:putative DNA-binding protein [Labilithrix luteola]|uniref:Putative DNA-binding protein n=1 Tax=Labilithrix luteola TaxID=1391654 RepID=A0A0K1Q368_9BACT|nr:helix-turn-helix transcriptional regulator [Labilithrix luteola]AKV00082.1 putative DNA-binding protein [Labilithrix luteola]
MTASSSKRAELAAFLRDRRGRISPADVGLPIGARRRTPGLRREEVALLADVGASWYTWLEQGRDIQVSEALLERLTSALRLDAAERSYLFELAQGRSPRAVDAPPPSVSPMLERMIEGHRFPVTVSTLRWDVVAMNGPALKLWGDMRGTNAMRNMFLGEVSPFATVEREAHARNLVARFRTEAARASDHEMFQEIADELVAGSHEFRQLWTQHDLFAEPEGTKIVDVPGTGRIEIEHVTLMHVEPDARTLRVLFYAPVGAESAQRMARCLELD